MDVPGLAPKPLKGRKVSQWKRWQTLGGWEDGGKALKGALLDEEMATLFAVAQQFGPESQNNIQCRESVVSLIKVGGCTGCCT